MAVKFDPILGKLREDDSGVATIPEVTSDQSSGSWVLRTDPVSDGEAGVPRGMLLGLTYAGPQGSPTYQFSFKTEANTIIRVALS